MPIGVFDSGVGGLSILKASIKRLPHTDFIYIADSANCPWGEKDKSFIKRRAYQLTEFLISKGAMVVVVACNSASVNVIEYLRESFPDIRFVGVEPGIKPALKNTKSGTVAVLVTRATSRGDKFLDTMSQFGKNKRVITIIAPQLVDWVEEGVDISFCRKVSMEEILDPVITNGADQLALGCTHFPFLNDCISKCLPENVTIVDTSDAVAKQVQKIAESVMDTNEDGHLSFYTSGNPRTADKLIARLISIDDVTCEQIESGGLG
jgi:glutamate racemase